jgi:hypothetical protein
LVFEIIILKKVVPIFRDLINSSCSFNEFSWSCSVSTTPLKDKPQGMEDQRAKGWRDRGTGHKDRGIMDRPVDIKWRVKKIPVGH